MESERLGEKGESKKLKMTLEKRMCLLKICRRFVAVISLVIAIIAGIMACFMFMFILMVPQMPSSISIWLLCVVMPTIVTVVGLRVFYKLSQPSSEWEFSIVEKTPNGVVSVYTENGKITSLDACYGDEIYVRCIGDIAAVIINGCRAGLFEMSPKGGVRFVDADRDGIREALFIGNVRLANA